jgi:nucleotide-binding universal stress UspA family protein
LLTRDERERFAARLVSLTGAPFLEIVRYARREDIDLIVMGTHGRGAIAHLLVGSVAENVVRKAPCPVLTVPVAGHDFVKP